MLQHRPGDFMVSAHEEVAIGQIDAAIREIKTAAIEDGKNVNDHPPVDVDLDDFRGRLHKALDLLRKTRADIDREEDDPAARGLKHRAVEHINVAIEETQGAIYDVEHHR
jgi:hypothetical protein